MQALKAMLFGAKLPPQEEEPPQPVRPAKAGEERPGSSGHCHRSRTRKKSRMPAPEKPAVPMPAMVFAEDKASKPHAAPAMQFFGKGDDEESARSPGPRDAARTMTTA